MPELDFRAPRLFVDAPLREGERIALERNQSNYLGNVLRLSAGETILVFNGRDGEWQAAIEGRKRPDSLTIVAQTRPQDRLPDIAYVFAPLKHARLDYMVQKAVEMGASTLQPVLTRHTQVSRVNSERMRANVIEAAEQCGILSLAAVAEPVRSIAISSQRETAAPAGVLRRGGRDRQSHRGAATGANRGRGDRHPDRPRGRLCRGRARAAAAAAEDRCGCRWAPASCARTPPASPRWRWCRPRWGTGRHRDSQLEPVKTPPVKPAIAH